MINDKRRPFHSQLLDDVTPQAADAGRAEEGARTFPCWSLRDEAEAPLWRPRSDASQNAHEQLLGHLIVAGSVHVGLRSLTGTGWEARHEQWTPSGAHIGGSLRSGCEEASGHVQQGASPCCYDGGAVLGLCKLRSRAYTAPRMRRVAYLELAGRPGARFAARLAQDWRGVDLIVGLAVRSTASRQERGVARGLDHQRRTDVRLALWARIWGSDGPRSALGRTPKRSWMRERCLAAQGGRSLSRRSPAPSTKLGSRVP